MPKIAQKQEDFAEFLERVNAHLPCEACRKGAWTLPAANQGLVLNLPVGVDPGLENSARVPAYMLLCTSCGNIRLHARTIVDKSIDISTLRAR